MTDISSKIFGKYQYCFIYCGFEWSDEDETTYAVRWGALSAPGKIRVRYVPLFRLWQFLGLIHKGIVE